MSKIVIFPNPMLRKKAVDVGKVSEDLIKEIKNLKDILGANENGAGLAGPQIGVSKRFFAVKKERELKVYINPKIVKTFGVREEVMIEKENGTREGFLEGCLSFPGFYGRVKRWLKIKASWQEIRKGRLIRKEGVLGGFEAIVWQHERDHLDGILFVDYVKKDGGKFFGSEDGEMVKWKIKDLLKKEN